MAGKLANVPFREGIDPREQALYTGTDAASYLGIPPATLKSWLRGRNYPTGAGQKFFEPLIEIADPENQLLSFFNLAELHVLAATRYQHRLSIKAIRSAIETVRRQFTGPYPLLSEDFKTNGRDLFVQTITENVNLSQPGQLNFREIMDKFLAHVVDDERGHVNKIFPLIAHQPDDHIISITHGVSSSQPAVDGTGVAAWLIHARSSQGESVEDIAEDFDISTTQARRAIEFIEPKAA